MISEKLKLDDIDRQIITLVQENPNLTHTQIAENINRSQPTVGMRIKKLESNGILQFQPGINFKRVDLFLATVELNTKKPEEIMEMAKFCPFILNAFRLSGEHNICILLASSKLDKLDKIINYHFRDNPDIQSCSMEIVTEISKDLILPIDFDSEKNAPTSEEGCREMCKLKIAKSKGLM
ncbi:MAG: Lrp/AsnC family transcriptional regulator [Promethearchaeota archaeon]